LEIWGIILEIVVDYGILAGEPGRIAVSRETGGGMGR